MGIVRKQSVRSSIIVYAGFIVGSINVLYLFPTYFTPEEFGLTRLFFSVATTLAQFAALGVPTIIMKFFPYYRDNLKNKESDFLALFLRVALVGFCLVVLATILFNDRFLATYQKRSPLFVQFYYLIYPFSFFLLLFNIFEAYAGTLYKTAVPISIRDFGIRIVILILVLLFLARYISFSVFMHLFSLQYLIAVALIVYYLFRLREISFNFKLSNVTRRFSKKLFSYGTYVYAGGLFSVVAENIDIFMIAGIVGLGGTAVFTIANYIVTIIQVPQRSIGNISLPIISRAWKEKDMLTLRTLYKKTSINQMVIGLFLFLLIWVNIDNFFTFLPSVYSAGKYIILIMAVGKVIDLGTGMNAEILYTSNFWRFNFLSHVVLLLLLIPLNYILVVRFGIIGSAISYLISYTIFNFMRFVFIWWQFKLQPFSVQTVLCIGIAASTFVCVWLLPFLFNVIIDSVAKTILLTIIFAFAVLKSKVSEDINIFFTQSLDRAKKVIAGPRHL